MTKRATIYLQKTSKPKNLSSMRRTVITPPPNEDGTPGEGATHVMYEPWTRCELRKIAKKIGNVRLKRADDVQRLRKHIRKHDKENKFGLK